MRKFIISDIHGLGNVYYSIMNYLDNIKQNEEISLYINGDLFDRGLESVEILLDIKKRIENGEKITYLGGNHELLMHQFYKDYLDGKYTYFNNWYDNGGAITDDNLQYHFDYKMEKVLDVVDFVSNLKIYHKFKETINDKPIVLVHAKCPKTVKDVCDLKIYDDNDIVFDSVWAREYVPYYPKNLQKRIRVGHSNYFTIIGHTPNNSNYGYYYHALDNYLNIDGGCARYASGLFEYDHVPLVEIENSYFKILTFNNNNEIITGNYFDGTASTPYTIEELNKERSYLNKDLKIKKLRILDDDIIGY